MNQNKNEEKGPNKEFTIIINGRPKIVMERKLSFSEIITLAFENPPAGQNIIFTITYRKGNGNKPEGTLIADETVKIKEGMVFNVTATDKS